MQDVGQGRTLRQHRIGTGVVRVLRGIKVTGDNDRRRMVNTTAKRGDDGRTIGPIGAVDDDIWGDAVYQLQRIVDVFRRIDDQPVRAEVFRVWRPGIAVVEQ